MQHQPELREDHLTLLNNFGLKYLFECLLRINQEPDFQNHLSFFEQVLGLQLRFDILC